MIPFLGNEELWKAGTAQGIQVGSTVQDGACPRPPGSDSAMKSSTGTGSGPHGCHLLEAVGGWSRGKKSLLSSVFPPLGSLANIYWASLAEPPTRLHVSGERAGRKHEIYPHA